VFILRPKASTKSGRCRACTTILMAEIAKRFDIFWFGEKGAIWVEAVDTLEIAKVRIEQLLQSRSGRYVVIDSHTGNRISFPEDDKRN
jgi:hypothetical protein